jgi:hypothetical protein
VRAEKVVLVTKSSRQEGRQVSCLFVPAAAGDSISLGNGEALDGRLKMCIKTSFVLTILAGVNAHVDAPNEYARQSCSNIN